VRPSHPCAVPNCSELVSGRARCVPHTITREERNPKDPAQAKFYGSVQWKAIRTLVRRRDPICKQCHRAPTQQAHHKDNDWRNNQLANLEGVCGTCHRKHSGAEHHKKRQAEQAPAKGIDLMKALVKSLGEREGRE
jgi:hypothetical protein